MRWGKLFNDGWEFAKQILTETKNEEVPSVFVPVEIPHDWLIYDSYNLYQDSIGWYRKSFMHEKKPSKQYFLRFDGIYMDSTIYINGNTACEWKYGYSSFVLDVTGFLKEGANDILVKVVYHSPNSRWYSGAGIYRNIWFQEVDLVWLIQDGIYISEREEQNGNWRVTVSAEIGVKQQTDPQDITLHFQVFKRRGNTNKNTAGMDTVYSSSQFSNYEEDIADGQEPIAECLVGAAVIQEKKGGSDNGLFYGTAQLMIDSPELWSPDNPCLYIVKTELHKAGKTVQTEYTRFGFRTLAYKPDSGFWLNGRNIKIKGVCEHHDLGCLGASYNQTAMRRKLQIVKEMGVNAVRTAHNMPAAEWMDLADEMGILIDSEGFDMWEKSKTTYDYARFFTEWHCRDIASWIRRDRNHPSVIMWSIGNEIYDTHEGERGLQITKELSDEVRKHDPAGNAPITIGSNYMPWENAQKCADIVKLAGYNYSEKYYDAHHKEHPDWIIYGSETASIVQSRGIYHFPYSKSILADEDEQCSSLGNSRTSWGAVSTEMCIAGERDNHFSCGQFIWTGFDYIGEPTPYHTKNSYFGQIDTAGFPKDSYYIYQAEWQEAKKDILHLFPYWDFNEGQTVDVRAASNAGWLELFINGKSQGIRKIDHVHGTILTGDWRVTYEPGEIRVKAYDDKKALVAEAFCKSFQDAAEIRCSADRESALADGRDLLFVEISMVDKDGHAVENANNRVRVDVSGSGRLAGLDNGDSTDFDSYKGNDRRLFGGKLLAVIQTKTVPGKITVTVSSYGLPDQELILWARECREKFVVIESDLPSGEGKRTDKTDVPVRKIELLMNGSRKLDKACPQAEITAKLYPENAVDTVLFWSVVDDAGIPSNLAQISVNGNHAVVKAKGDGYFRVRCMSRNGTEKIRLISQLDFEVTGIGTAYLNPYEFVCGGLYQYSKGEVGNGNEYGVATARDGESQVGYRELDFGPVGSDEITLPVFALSDEPYRIRIWEGMPEEEGSILIGDVLYQKPSRWNVYQEETYHLDKKLKGITSICFVVDKKIHIKGFIFTRQNPAYDCICAAHCKHVYGDCFKVERDGIYDIGNNVTLEFPQMDFGEDGLQGIAICGSSPIEKNTIHIRFENQDTGEDIKQIVEFGQSSGMDVRTYRLDRVKGRQNVYFIFLPGSRFDIKWFRFLPDKT